jgi:hypothetical protein
VLCTTGIGDLDELLTPEIGVLIRDHTQTTYGAAAQRLVDLLAEAATPARCRAVAQRELSLNEVGNPRYRALYDQVARAIDSGREQEVSKDAM